MFRKLKDLDYLTSYSHGGRFYTLREIARFGTDGLWSCEAAWFSRYGTLLATAEAFIRSSVAGYFAEELTAILHVGTQDVLRHLVQQKRIARELISGLFLYTSTDPAIRQLQRLTRRGNQSVPTIVDASRLEVSPDEMKAAIILFYSLLDEQQRRGPMRRSGIHEELGHGGDSVLAEVLGLDPHTVARGRRQLLDQDVAVGRVRQSGAGRKPVEKKRPKWSRLSIHCRNTIPRAIRSPVFVGPTRRLPESPNCCGNSISRSPPIPWRDCFTMRTFSHCV